MRRNGVPGVYQETSVLLMGIMFWGYLTYEGVGTLGTVEGNINSRKYIKVLDEICGL